MPIRRKVVHYIQRSKSEGYTFTQIRKELVRAGYPERDINDSMTVAAQKPELFHPAPHLDFVYASFMYRFVAWTIDAAVLFGSILIIHGLLAVAGLPLLPQPGQEVYYFIIFLFEGFGMWAYFAVLESSKWHASVGKKLMGLAVTDQFGFPVDFDTAALRSAMRIVSSLPLGLGFIMALWSNQNATFHDIVAKTRVMKADSL